MFLFSTSNIGVKEIFIFSFVLEKKLDIKTGVVQKDSNCAKILTGLASCGAAVDEGYTRWGTKIDSNSSCTQALVYPGGSVKVIFSIFLLTCRYCGAAVDEDYQGNVDPGNVNPAVV